MTPTEALQILDAATRRTPATRDEHVVFVNALRALEAAVTPAPEATETST